MPSRKATRPSDGRLARNKGTAPKRPKTRMQQLIDGDITIDDLDDEEIARCQVKDARGKFSGRPRAMLPAKLHQAMMKAYKERTESMFREYVKFGVEVLVDVANDRRAAAPARVRAAEVLIERGVGKVPDAMQVSVELKPYEEDVESLLIDVGDDDGVATITTLGEAS